GGGTRITIRGENFKEGATVTIGGTALKNLVISEDGMSVTGVTPGGKPGPQQVIARNPKAEDPSAPATFTYEGIQVISTTPTDGEVIPWYPRLSTVTVTLSQDIQAGTESITVGDSMGDVTYDASTKTITFMAAEPFATGQNHTAIVSGVKDTAGNTLPEYTFNFTIEEAVKVDWYTVKEGDTLPIIAAKPEVYEDESKWKDIYSANQDEFVSADGKHGNDIILDYRNLKPGMTLYIPRETPAEN
ncbi:LysM peptidoglycan-binding domain-containing protein, partial [Candidatus Poribacteria bacterium]|nr:LysM peptidoglycan-binding domain-containing protein [Candidatus Poribacteria bacterium]